MTAKTTKARARRRSGNVAGTETAWRTFFAPIHIPENGEVADLTRGALSQSVVAAGVAVQQILAELQRAVKINKDEDSGIISADLIFPCQSNDLPRAENLMRQERKVLPEVNPKTGKPYSPKDRARPQWRNSYRLEEILLGQEQDVRLLRFRIAERFGWTDRRGDRQEELDVAGAKIPLQQIIQSWLKPDLSSLPSNIRSGVCQQAAQQFLSNIGLVASDTQPTTSFPSLEDRDPQKREEAWLSSLETLVSSKEPFDYQLAREVYPGKFADDDPRGDRLVNCSPLWRNFASSPFPRRLPLNFIKASDIVVYRRRWTETQRKGKLVDKERLYAALPLFTGLSPDSPLGRLADNPVLFWWRNHLSEFEAMPAWSGAELTSRQKILLVPLCYDPPTNKKGEVRKRYNGSIRSSRFEQALSSQDGRKVNWSILTESRGSRGKGRGKSRWLIHFATSREVSVSPRERVLGIHFGVDPIIWWSLQNSDGKILVEGDFSGNPVLDEALRAKGRLEGDQRNGRWIGDRRFAPEIKRRTYEIARAIIALAAEHNAALALEDIGWVDKQHGGKDANLRFTLWNFAALKTTIKNLAADRLDISPEAIPVVPSVSDYLLRFTCPACGACRSKGKNEETAETWRTDDSLHCRKCGFEGEIPDVQQARLVASVGAKRLRAMLSKEE